MNNDFNNQNLNTGGNNPNDNNQNGAFLSQESNNNDLIRPAPAKPNYSNPLPLGGSQNPNFPVNLSSEGDLQNQEPNELYGPAKTNAVNPFKQNPNPVNSYPNTQDNSYASQNTSRSTYLAPESPNLSPNTVPLNQSNYQTPSPYTPSNNTSYTGNLYTTGRQVRNDIVPGNNQVESFPPLDKPNTRESFPEAKVETQVVHVESRKGGFSFFGMTIFKKLINCVGCFLLIISIVIIVLFAWIVQV